MDAKFHCSRHAKKSGKKSRHRVLEACPDLMLVLAMTPEYGVLIKETEELRKMRLSVPGLNVGKSGGYRLIYRAKLMDECWHITFLETYFKGDLDDLPKKTYQALNAEAKDIMANPLQYDWEPFQRNA
jgi:mRNA-degrading endonuclease RelE of RelBE toxin-antitoxin system